MASCPKCGAEWAMGAKECPQCGVIYARYKYTPPKKTKVEASTNTKLTQQQEWLIIGAVGVVFAAVLYIADPAWWVYVAFLIIMPAAAITWECFRVKRSASKEAQTTPLSASTPLSSASITDNAPIESPQQQEALTYISFQYSSADGEETHRVVDVYRVYKEGKAVYINGFCRTRGAERTFRANRIEGQIFEPDTMQLYTPQEFAARYGVEMPPDYEYEEYEEPEERQYWEVCERVPVEANLEIVYKGFKRPPVTFHIHTRTYDGTTYLDAYCDERGRNLFLTVANIQSCVDMDTGEVVQDVPAHLLRKYRESPIYALEQGKAKLKDILPVLFYVGKADGRLSAAERAILRDVVRRTAAHEGVTDKMIDRLIDKLDVPPLAAAKAAVDRIAASHPQQMGTVYKIAQRMVATDKSVKPEEAEILEYLAGKLPGNTKV